MEYKQDNGWTIKIERDQNPSDPRDDDNLGRMICFHRHYTLGDKHEYKSASEFAEWMTEHRDEIGACLPLFLYDHGGISIRSGSKGPVDSQWDWSTVGVIYVTKEKIKEEYGEGQEASTKATEMLQAEVRVYDNFLTGEVWGYEILDDQGERVEQCWDFNGSEEDCLKEAKTTLKVELEYRGKQKRLLDQCCRI